MFYLTTHSTHFIYGYMASNIWSRTILIVRKETRCRHIGYSFRLTSRVLLYAPSYRHDCTYHGLCYTSRGALAETRNSSMGPPHEGSIRQSTGDSGKQEPPGTVHDQDNDVLRHLDKIAILFASIFVTERCQLPGLHQLFKVDEGLSADCLLGIHVLRLAFLVNIGPIDRIPSAGRTCIPGQSK